MSAEKRAVLRRVRAFADLSDEDCDLVLGRLKARRGNPGDVLFKQGDAGTSLVIVLDGHLTARVRTASGAEEDVARLGPGEVVGEMAFIDAEPRSASVVVTGGAPVTVLEFTREALATLFRDAPRVASAILRNVLVDVARRLRDAGEKLAEGAGGAERGPASLGRPGQHLTAEQLRGIPALAGYPSADLELLAHVATSRSFRAGEVLLRAGSEGDACFMIASGEVTVTRPGSSAAIATLGPGALVGQLALLDRAPRSATVTAATDTLALEIRGDAFVNLVRASSPVALRFQWQVALAGVKQLRTATGRLAEQRTSLSGASVDGWDDWDSGGSGAVLELDYGKR